MTVEFKRLNNGWNAEPNAPDSSVVTAGHDIRLSFLLNAFQYDFAEGNIGILQFSDCSRYRIGDTNDEGWYRGQCRYSSLAPSWGEFYELSGDDPLADAPTDWEIIGGTGKRHFLFYLRDETFECFASDWCFERPT